MTEKEIDNVENELHYKSKAMDRYSLFCPRTKKGLLHDYPELKEVKEFSSKHLSQFDLLFVWFFAFEASPCSRIGKKEEKAKRAYNYASTFLGKYDTERKKRNYIACDFPDSVKNAINRMSRYKLGPRVKAKRMVDKILSNMEHMATIDAKTKANFVDKEGLLDVSKYKAYIDLSTTVVKNLPLIIAQAETGFGVSETEDAFIEDFAPGDIAKMFHTQKEEE